MNRPVPGALPRRGLVANHPYSALMYFAFQADIEALERMDVDVNDDATFEDDEDDED